MDTQVKEAVRRRLDGDERVSLRSIANDLGISSRALQRRLSARGLSFTMLARDIRAEKAIELLGERSLSLSEIAFTLGYAEHSHFTRAFRNRFGKPPSRYRDEKLTVR